MKSKGHIFEMPPLSKRQEQVLIGIASGKTLKEIAADMGVKHRTAESHCERIHQKTGLRTIALLTHFAISKGLIPLLTFNCMNIKSSECTNSM